MVAGRNMRFRPQVNLRRVPNVLGRPRPEQELPDFLIDSADRLTYGDITREIPRFDAAIFDGDCSILAQHAMEFTPEMATMLRSLGGEGVKLFMMSNIYGARAIRRIDEIGKITLSEHSNERLFTEIVTPDTLFEDPRVHLPVMGEEERDLGALTCAHEGGNDPSTLAYLMAALQRREPHVNAKPNPAMINYILEKYHLDPRHVLVLGDQWRADVKAAQLAGTHSCLVPPYGGEDHWLVELLVRKYEEDMHKEYWGGSFPGRLTPTEAWAAEHGIDIPKAA